MLLVQMYRVEYEICLQDTHNKRLQYFLELCTQANVVCIKKEEAVLWQSRSTLDCGCVISNSGRAEETLYGQRDVKTQQLTTQAVYE